jgi:hypothetical protein
VRRVRRELFGLTMSKLTGTVWPPLETTYTDEFGHVELEVYKTAGALWDAYGEQYELSKLADAPTGLRLMLKAAASVSQKYLDPGVQIESLPNYLFKAYKRLVLAELEKRNGRRDRDAERHAEASSLPDTTAADIDRKILIQQIINRMDAWTREIFELLTLRYNFEEVGKMRGESGHRIRTKFAKKLKSLKKHLEAESAPADKKRASSSLLRRVFK